MPSLSLAETSIASRNAMLSAKVAKALYRRRAGAQLSDQERQVLGRGASLLSAIVQGALLLDRKQLEAGFDADLDLKTYGHALSALSRLSDRIPISSSKGVVFVKVFKDLRAPLEKAAQGKQADNQSLETVARFFSLLSDLFLEDLQAPAAPVDPFASYAVAG